MNEVTARPERQIMVTEDQKQLVKSIVFPGCSDDEMRLYLFECERRGVHPLDRLIFPIKRNDGDGGKRVTFQCSVDYLRAEAADTGEYDGQDDPVFGTATPEGYPESATVSVYKKDMSRPVAGTARWAEFYPGDKLGFMWRKMPFHMLAKCAEVLALRKAFPKRLAGLYVPEEMQAGDGVEKKPPLKEPQKKAEPTDALQTVIIQIHDVTTKAGESNGKKWSLHNIKALKDGVVYKTFSDTYKKMAEDAMAAGHNLKIIFKTEKNGNLITGMDVAEG